MWVTQLLQMSLRVITAAIDPCHNGAKTFLKSKTHSEGNTVVGTDTKILYVSLILGQLLDLIPPATINISEPRFKSYDSWDMAN